MRRFGTIFGATVLLMLGVTGVASAEDFVLYKDVPATRSCTVAERWQVGAIPGVDTCVVERPLNVRWR